MATAASAWRSIGQRTGTKSINATTTEGYNGSANSNRVVRIVDTDVNATVTTVAQAPERRDCFPRCSDRAPIPELLLWVPEPDPPVSSR